MIRIKLLKLKKNTNDQFDIFSFIQNGLLHTRRKKIIFHIKKFNSTQFTSNARSPSMKFICLEKMVENYKLRNYYFNKLDKALFRTTMNQFAVILSFTLSFICHVIHTIHRVSLQIQSKLKDIYKFFNAKFNSSQYATKCGLGKQRNLLYNYELIRG